MKYDTYLNHIGARRIDHIFYKNQALSIRTATLRGIAARLTGRSQERPVAVQSSPAACCAAC